MTSTSNEDSKEFKKKSEAMKWLKENVDDKKRRLVLMATVKEVYNRLTVNGLQIKMKTDAGTQIRAKTIYTSYTELWHIQRFSTVQHVALEGMVEPDMLVIVFLRDAVIQGGISNEALNAFLSTVDENVKGDEGA